MGWREIEAGVNEGSISFAQAPEQESLIQGIGRAAGNYLEMNKDAIAAKAKTKSDKAAADKLEEAANAKAAKMAKSAMNTYSFDTSDPTAYRRTLEYALLNPDLDDLNTWIEKQDFPKVTSAPSVGSVNNQTEAAIPIVNGGSKVAPVVTAETTVDAAVTTGAYKPIKNALTFAESSDNINALWTGVQNNKFSNFNASTSTMAEVLDFVKKDGEYAEWSKTKSNTNEIHTPVGKHQFVGRTLRDIMDRAGRNGDLEKMGIDNNTVFNEEVQDKLFEWYAKDTITTANNNAASGDGNATPEELRAAFAKRWQAIGQKDANNQPKISDAELDEIISKVQDGTILSMDAAVEAVAADSEVAVQTDAALEKPITLDVKEATNNPTYATIVPDPLKGLDKNELTSIATNSLTEPALRERASEQLKKMAALEETTGAGESDPLSGNVSLLEVLSFQTDPKYKDDVEFQARVTARIATLTGNFAIGEMSPESREAQIAIYKGMQSRNEILNPTQLEAFQRLQDAQSPIVGREDKTEAEKLAQAAFENSNEAFMANITDLNGVKTAESVLRARTLEAGNDVEKLAKIEVLENLVAQARVSFSEEITAAEKLRLAEVAKAESVETFMEGIKSIKDVINKEGIVEAMQVSVSRGSERTPEEIEQQKKIDTLKDLLGKRREAFVKQQAIDDEAAVAKNAKMKTDEQQSINEGTARSLYIYSEDGTLAQTSTVYAYLDANGKRVWQDEAFNVVSEDDIAKGELFTPQRADTFIKTYNRQVTAAVNSVLDAKILTNSLLELKAKATPELLNPIIQSIGNKADFAKSMVDAWNVVTKQFKDAGTNAETNVGAEVFENNVIKRWENTILGDLGELNAKQQEFAGQFLRVAYQIAKVRGSVGQALSNKELDSILDSLGKGIVSLPDFLSLMDDTLELELETAEIRRSGATKAFLYNQGGLRNGNAVTDIIDRTGIGLSVEENFLSDATPERRAQYEASKANWGSSTTIEPPKIKPEKMTIIVTATQQAKLKALGYDFEIGSSVVMVKNADGDYLPEGGSN